MKQQRCPGQPPALQAWVPCFAAPIAAASAALRCVGQTREGTGRGQFPGRLGDVQSRPCVVPCSRVPQALVVAVSPAAPRLGVRCCRSLHGIIVGPVPPLTSGAPLVPRCKYRGGWTGGGLTGVPSSRTGLACPVGRCGGCDGE